jgi:hypothetical protein
MVICDGFLDTQQNTSPFPQPPNVDSQKDQADAHMLTANSNYDNLRNIDSDESSVLLAQSPDLSSLNSTPAKKNPNFLQNSQSNTKTTPQSQSLPITMQTTTSTPLNVNDKNLFDIIKNKNTKNINLTTMSEIIPNGRTNGSNGGSTVPNGNHSTQADTQVRSFRDRMKFFESIKEASKDEPKREFRLCRQYRAIRVPRWFNFLKIF